MAEGFTATVAHKRARLKTQRGFGDHYLKTEVVLTQVAEAADQGQFTLMIALDDDDIIEHLPKKPGPREYEPGDRVKALAGALQDLGYRTSFHTGRSGYLRVEWA